MNTYCQAWHGALQLVVCGVCGVWRVRCAGVACAVCRCGVCGVRCAEEGSPCPTLETGPRPRPSRAASRMARRGCLCSCRAGRIWLRVQKPLSVWWRRPQSSPHRPGWLLRRGRRTTVRADSAPSSRRTRGCPGTSMWLPTRSVRARTTTCRTTVAKSNPKTVVRWIAPSIHNTGIVYAHCTRAQLSCAFRRLTRIESFKTLRGISSVFMPKSCLAWTSCMLRAWP